MDDLKIENKKHRKTKVKKNTNNLKANTFNSGVRANRALRRNLDKATNRHHLPIERYEGEIDPPIVVVVVGPPKVGKSTLIASLIKRYNKQPITEIKGPVTLVTGKNQRITLIECNNDINSMIDLAKVADLVLILADATFGFEMETFEFLNILHVHGFPKVIGIMTHLDLLQANKSLSRYKKKLKKRFWQEVYDGAKLLYLSDFRNNVYDKKQMIILSRYLTVSKSPPPAWRLTHPHILVDRVEDLTNPELIRTQPDSNRLVTFYGYIHGTYMRHTNKVHIPGCGDYVIKNMCFLPDPCEPPDSAKKRVLDENERIMYAPFSGMGNIIYDKDAVYVKTEPTKNSITDDLNEEKNNKVSSILNMEQTVDKKLSSAPIQIFQDGPLVYDHEVGTDSNDSEESLSDTDSVSENELQFDDHNLKNTQDFYASRAPHMALYKSIYTQNGEACESVRPNKEALFVEKTLPPILHKDTTKYCASTLDWNDESLLDSLKSKFFNTFVHIEEEEEIESDKESEMEETTLIDEDSSKKSKQRIRKLLEQDEKYLIKLQEKVRETAEIHNKEFEDMPLNERILFQGYQPGMYVRIEIESFPHEFIDHFDPTYPIIIGGLLPGEDDMGFMKLRVKKHRFHDKILKNKDPLILSAGWRRFQTIPLYSIEDHNKRLRSIKYTPKLMHCIAVCFGPIMPPNFGVVGIQKIGVSKDVGFRIALTGVTLENDKSCQIFKKLKLVGYPYKIHKNSAFIEKMFSTALEVSKFEGAFIKTVSGIRGHVKKPVSDREGAFRAKFEDKILMSDIVFLRTWLPIECPRFYYLISNLLMSTGDRISWSGMRTVYELRKELEIPISDKKDSKYKDIERLPVKFAPLRIPDNIVKRLPFSAKPKNMKQPIEKVKRPQLQDESDKKALALLNELSLINKDNDIKRKLKRKQSAEEYKSKLLKSEEEQKKRKKINQKLIYRIKARK